MIEIVGTVIGWIVIINICNQLIEDAIFDQLDMWDSD